MTTFPPYEFGGARGKGTCLAMMRTLLLPPEAPSAGSSPTDAIRSMSHDLAAEVAPRPNPIDQVCALTREAPIHSLAIAFLLGLIITRR
ncbi:hypothetical protein ACO2JO_04845 [Leptospira interrogans]